MMRRLVLVLIVAPLARAQLSDAARQFVVDMHNQLRVQVANGLASEYNGVMLPQASNMQQMTYDVSLEMEAYNWAQNCMYHHPSVLDYGQNIAMSFAMDQVTALNDSLWAFWNEISQYPYGPQVLVFTEQTGHFTQMVWADTNSVGCAIQLCSNGFDNGWNFAQWTFAVCDYRPAGNVIGEPLYLIGPACSNCPQGTTACNQGLCAGAP